MVVLGRKRLYSGKNSCIRARWLQSGESGSIRANMVVFGQRYFSSGKVVDLGEK